MMLSYVSRITGDRGRSLGTTLWEVGLHCGCMEERAVPEKEGRILWLLLYAGQLGPEPAFPIRWH